MVYDFVAIDFETATEGKESACSVGIAAVKDCEVVEKYYSLLQPPENEYAYANTKVHGITPKMTVNAPTLTETWPEISKFFSLHNRVRIGHENSPGAGRRGRSKVVNYLDNLRYGRYT